MTPEEWRRRALNVNRQQVLPPFDNQVMEQVVQDNAAEGGYQVGLIIKIAIYCPQGSGTLRQQLLMMH